MSFPISLPASRIDPAAEAQILRWEILGSGWIAERFIESVRAHTKQDIVAVGSRSKERAAEFASRWGLKRPYGDYKGLADRGTLLDTSLELWDRQFNTNARGPFLLMQGVVRHLVDTGQPGSIVNILSMVAHCGQSYLTPYSASKGALATLTKNVANAFAARRIRCNGILTGWMDTPGESVTQQKFHGVGEDWVAKAEAAQPRGQLVKPDQLAGLVAYLLSPESGVMTGALVDYDQHVAGAYPE